MLVDWSRIDSLTDGDDPEDLEWIKQMVETLRENMKTRLENIQSYAQAKDSDKLRSELHQVKGVAANFGLRQLYEQVLDAESKVKSGDLEGGITASLPISQTWKDTETLLVQKFFST